MQLVPVLSASTLVVSVQAVSSKQISSAKASVATYVPNPVNTPVPGTSVRGSSGHSGVVGGGGVSGRQFGILGTLGIAHPMDCAKAQFTESRLPPSVSCASYSFLAFSPRFCLI